MNKLKNKISDSLEDKKEQFENARGKVAEQLDETKQKVDETVKETKRKTKKTLKIVFITVFVIAVLIAGYFLFFANSEKEIITTSELEKVVNIDELSTSKFMYGGIAEKKKDNGKTDYHVKYQATLNVSVDMSDIKFVIDNESKTVTPILPKLIINADNANVDPKSISTIPSNEDDDIKSCFEICKEDIAKEASNNKELHKAALTNLKSFVEAMVTPLIENKGYELKWDEEK